MTSNRFILTPEDEAYMDFDAKHNVEPPRAIAERIALRYGAGPTHSMVDSISHAIEDARELGEKRVAAEMLALLKLAADIIGHPDDAMSKLIRDVIAKVEART